MNDDAPETVQPEDGAGDAEQVRTGDAEQVRTGVDSVDAVIAAVEELEERPIEEHVGVFETAHDQLRRALDAQPPADRTESS